MNAIETKVTCPKCGNLATPLPDKLVRCRTCEVRRKRIDEMRRELTERFPKLAGIGEGGRHDG